jgi:hypothetical protein
VPTSLAERAAVPTPPSPAASDAPSLAGIEPARTSDAPSLAGIEPARASDAPSAPADAGRKPARPASGAPAGRKTSSLRQLDALLDAARPKRSRRSGDSP